MYFVLTGRSKLTAVPLSPIVFILDKFSFLTQTTTSLSVSTIKLALVQTLDDDTAEVIDAHEFGTRR